MAITSRKRPEEFFHGAFVVVSYVCAQGAVYGHNAAHCVSCAVVKGVFIERETVPFSRFHRISAPRCQFAAHAGLEVEIERRRRIKQVSVLLRKPLPSYGRA